MIKKKGFSLIEILIVLSIVLILLIVFQNFFKPKDVKFYYGQNCVNDLYGFVNNFINDGLSSKGFYSGNTILYPNNYELLINPSENRIIKRIDSQQLATANLSGEASSRHFCNMANSYIVILSGEDMHININKGIGNNQFDLRRSVSSGIIITGHTDLFLCKEDKTDCFHIGKYLIDKRNQSINKKVCMGFSGNECAVWNQ